MNIENDDIFEKDYKELIDTKDVEESLIDLFDLLEIDKE